jgi:hypothetical protein
MEAPRARIQDFIRAYFTNAGALMSGIPTIPAAGLGLYVQNATARYVFWVTAAFCLALSSYFVWREERLRVIALDKSEQREIVRAELSHLRNLGVGIRNDASPGLLTRDQWPAWIERTAWNAEAIAAIRKVSNADAGWFEIADIMPKARLGVAIDEAMPHDEVAQALRRFQLHDFRLVKLEQLISGEKGKICQ